MLFCYLSPCQRTFANFCHLFHEYLRDIWRVGVERKGSHWFAFETLRLAGTGQRHVNKGDRRFFLFSVRRPRREVNVANPTRLLHGVDFAEVKELRQT